MVKNNNDFKYMGRCCELASLGLGNVAPNPMVGCVIVHQSKIIGEGYHRKYGEAHAEVNAIQSVKDKSLLPFSKLYVNLEPCSHYGKTPPCSDLIIEHKIPEVIIGMVDPFEKVSGKGIEKLKKSGCKVTINVLENQCKELNKRFLAFVQKKRPYVILKWAQTQDGFIDVIRDKETPIGPTWISSQTARILVHKWRNEEQAIMVGTNTVEKDNPSLTNRYWGGGSPIRVLIDRDLRLGQSHSIFSNEQITLVYNRSKNSHNGTLEKVKIDFNHPTLPQILNDLYNRGIQSLIVEGGAKLLSSFLENNIWDQARIFIGEVVFGKGVEAPAIPGKVHSSIQLWKSRLVCCMNNLD